MPFHEWICFALPINALKYASLIADYFLFIVTPQSPIISTLPSSSARSSSSLPLRNVILPSYFATNFPFPKLILTSNLPPLLSTLTSPLFFTPLPLPLPFRSPLGSRLCLLLGRSLSSTASFRFLVKRARSSGRSASLTILLFFLDSLGVATAMVAEEADDEGVGALMVGPEDLGIGRLEGGADGRGEAAAEG